MIKEEWTIKNDRLSDAITKNSLRKVKKLCSKAGFSLINASHPVTGETPLRIGVRWKRIKILKYLLSNGADPNARRHKFNDTPLHLAAMEGHDKALQLLLKHGGDRLLENFNKNIPIDLAIEQKQEKCIEILILPPERIHNITCLDSSLNTITLQFDVPESKGSTISEYTIRVYKDPHSASTMNVPPLRTISNIDNQHLHRKQQQFRRKQEKQQKQQYVIDHCVPGITYHISIQAYNDAGWSQESVRIAMNARPTPPKRPTTPCVKNKSTTFLQLDWKEPITNGYPIDCYEIGYRVERLQENDKEGRPNRRLTQDEAKDQALFDSIQIADHELKEAKRQDKV
jgi:hypothetical protein